jgi:type IV secretory pathway VirJ component
VIALAFLVPVLAAAAPAAAPGTLHVPGIGAVQVHAPAGRPVRVVVAVDDRDAASSADLADALAAGGALVIGLDARAYLASRQGTRCVYPAGDLEELAQHVEKVRGLEAYLRPVLVGRGRGAAVAWTAFAQGPPGTFAGVVLAEPCPDEPLPFRLCAGFGPAPRKVAGGELPALGGAPGPAEVLAGPGGRACPAARARVLAEALGARLTELPAAAGASPALAGAVARIAPPPPPPTAAPAPGSISDLPVVEVPAEAPGNRLAILLSGDGGWVGIDKALAAELTRAGVAVVGLDSLRYLWTRRSPDEMARDVGRIAAHYAAAWGRTDLLLVGYSRGADLAPFVAARLPAEVRARLRLVALLGPSTFAEFEVHAVDLFSSTRRADALPTEPAVRESKGAFPVLCVHGSDESDSLCPALADLPWVKSVPLRGGHHFDGDYAGLARTVLDAVPAP